MKVGNRYWYRLSEADNSFTARGFLARNRPVGLAPAATLRPGSAGVSPAGRTRSMTPGPGNESGDRRSGCDQRERPDAFPGPRLGFQHRVLSASVRAALGPVRLVCNGRGLAAFRKSSLPSADTSKVFYLQYLEKFRLPFSASRCGKCFSPHFPQTENGRGFDSRCHIERGDIIIHV